ncbi:MAG TPA: Hsp33 family molecular chaperone HslO [Steroidobacteraceae bacterium]|nr:Hsp33 family molecular chaperone HslO [Steroidobacteraceae bacterium]
MLTETDRLRRFLFENAPVRGHWVHLSRSWLEARAHQNLPAPALELLGQSLVAATLLSASVKFSGTLTLQLLGSTGAVTMLVAQATDARTLRGVAHLAEDAATHGAGFHEQIDGGRLVVSVEQGDGVAPWQGIVPLEGHSLAACLAHYFEISEQQPTAIVLAADAGHAAGLLLQKLPTPGVQGESAAAGAQDLWEEVTALLATLGGDELLLTEPQALLHRLFNEHDVRVFDAEPVKFACRCDRERVSALLRGLGRDEIESILAEQGAVTVTCEFCQKPYRFDAVDAAQLFVPNAPVGNPSLN